MNNVQASSSNARNDRVGKRRATASPRHVSGQPGSARGWYRHALSISLVVGCLGSLLSIADAQQMPLGLPVDCKLGHDCFAQQMPDLDGGDGVLDPLCGRVTYQGHTGWDFRLRSLKDIAGDVAVIAVADGTVSRVRDGLPDQIFEAAKDRLLLRDRECGNGIMIDHPGVLSSQYCHLKNGSLVVRPGTQVRKGERIGSIGSSGLAEFPHVHLSVRRDGKLLEPLTGKSLEDEAHACGDLSGSLLDKASREALVQPTVAILEVGLAAAPPELSTLVRAGGPPLAAGRSSSTVAWLWAINVDAGSRFRIRVEGPDDTVWIDHTTDALPSRKANYLAYAGRKTAAKPGAYRLTVEISNGENQIASRIRSFTVVE